MKALSKKLELFRNICFIGLPNIILCTPAFSQQGNQVDPGRLQIGEMYLFVKDSGTTHELLLDKYDGAEVSDANGLVCNTNSSN
jgi:hypothetical protein